MDCGASSFVHSESIAYRAFSRVQPAVIHFSRANRFPLGLTIATPIRPITATVTAPPLPKPTPRRRRRRRRRLPLRPPIPRRLRHRVPPLPAPINTTRKQPQQQRLRLRRLAVAGEVGTRTGVPSPRSSTRMVFEGRYPPLC